MLVIDNIINGIGSCQYAWIYDNCAVKARKQIANMHMHITNTAAYLLVVFYIAVKNC